MMPEMDGIELCRLLKTNAETSHIPIILLTARMSQDVKQEGFETGADDYITKPFDVSVLKARIDNIISIRRALREKFSSEMVLKPKEIILSSPDEKFLKKTVEIIKEKIFTIDNN